MGVKIPKVVAENALNSFTHSVTKALKRGDKLHSHRIWDFLRSKEEGQDREESSDRKGDQDSCHKSGKIQTRQYFEEYGKVTPF